MFHDPVSHVIHETPTLRAVLHGQATARVLLSYDCPQSTSPVVSAPTLTRHALAADWAHLCVVSDTPDFGGNAGVDRLRGALSGATAAADDLAVLAIGQGAYGALRTAAALGAARMLLVSPRCRAQDDDVPPDLRDEMACEGLPAPDPDRLRALAPAGLRGLVLHDPFLAPRDRAHAAALGLRVLAMPFGGHPALRLMAAAGLMDRVLGALLGDRLQPGVFRALHREARARSGRYARRVERYRDRRGLPPGPELAVL